MRTIGIWGVAICLTACAGAPPPPAAPPPAPPPAAPAPEPEPPPPPPDYSLVPSAPERCAALAQAPADASCKVAKEKQRAALADAVEQTDAVARGQALAALEACESWPKGLVRAVRAELAPAECADVIVGDAAASADPALRDALGGLALAGQLERLVRQPPTLTPPFDKEQFQAFSKDTLQAWIVGQAKAIQQLSEAGAKLEGYGKGIVAIHAGLADMRFVEAVRAVPLPQELAADAELKDAYYGALDQALEPRKDRGRDAALVGLKAFSAVGVLEDGRVAQARALISQLYAGRRIDALDALLLPPVTAAPRDTVEQRLAAVLPTFYATWALADVDPSEAKLLAAFVTRGLAAPHRTALGKAKLSPEARLLYGRALLRRGQLYWEGKAFERAAEVLEPATKAGKLKQEAQLLRAVALALRSGPQDAIEMMAKGPQAPGKGELDALDKLLKAKGPLAAMAGYDAGIVLELAPPREQAEAFWNDLAKRYQQAALVAKAEDVKKLATERAKAAEETAIASK